MSRVCWWGYAVVMLALLGAALVASAPATVSPVTVLERSCLNPDDAELNTPWTVDGPGGLRVDLWCGTRLEVSGGACWIRLGADLIAVPCVGDRLHDGARSTP